MVENSEIRQCPNCGSRNVKPSFSNPATTIEGGRDDWECMECGYTGLMPNNNPELDEEDFEEKEEYQRINIDPQSSVQIRIFIFILTIIAVFLILDWIL